MKATLQVCMWAKKSTEKSRLFTNSEEMMEKEEDMLGKSGSFGVKRWMKDEQLRQIKYFRKEDKSCEPDLTPDEIFDMRDQIVAGKFRRPTGNSSDDDRQVSEVLTDSRSSTSHPRSADRKAEPNEGASPMDLPN